MTHPHLTWLIHVWHDSFICVTWLIHVCDMTHSYVWHDSFICVTWLIHICDVTHSYAWHDSFTCDMTHSHVRYDSFICATSLIHVCCDSFICLTWPIHMWHNSFKCDMTHSYAWHDSLLCDMTRSYVPWLIHVCSYTTPLPLRAQALAVWLKRSNEPLTKEPKGALRGFLVQPIADRVAQNLEIISKNFQFSTRRTRILMGFIIYYVVLIVNPMGRILVCWKGFKNNLEIQCHPICNRL